MTSSWRFFSLINDTCTHLCRVVPCCVAFLCYFVSCRIVLWFVHSLYFVPLLKARGRGCQSRLAFNPLSWETRQIQSQMKFIYLFVYIHQPRSSCAASKHFSLVNSLQQKLIGSLLAFELFKLKASPDCECKNLNGVHRFFFQKERYSFLRKANTSLLLWTNKEHYRSRSRSRRERRQERNRGAKGQKTTENKRATATKAGKWNRAGEGNSVGKEEGSLQKAVRRN